jgi:hypothetical protein
MPHAGFYENRALNAATADGRAAELACVLSQKRSVDRTDADALDTLHPRRGKVAIRMSSDRCAW